MKKTLRELELCIPTIPIFESRKITGGYNGLGEDYPDDGWWHGSPGEEDNPYEIPEVVIVAPEQPDPGYDPNEHEPLEREDTDSDRYDDSGREDTDSDRYDDSGREEDGTQDNGGYNVEAAVEHLRNSANASPQGQCARAVREALEAGGLSTDGRPGSAKDYDSFLPTIGFYEVDKNNYTPQVGDIVVHEAKEGHEHGHIAMYDGSNWISDFIQRDMFGGSAYRNDPDYSIWRR